MKQSNYGYKNKQRTSKYVESNHCLQIHFIGAIKNIIIHNFKYNILYKITRLRLLVGKT